MKHAQEVEGWALDEGNRITQTMSLNEATYVTVAKGLQRQHARSVRIVKRHMGAYQRQREVEKVQSKRDVLAGSILACVGLLAALQRGRGGKG